MLNQGRAELVNEIDKLKSELKDLRNKYDLLLESSASYFFIFEKQNIVEFSPKAEETLVFASDFSDKIIEELMPIFQMDGEKSSKTWNDILNNLTRGKSSPFEFEFLDKNGKYFSTIATISQVKGEHYLVHFDLVENTENLVSSANSLANNAPVFIKMTDEQNNITYFNKRWFDLLESDRTDVYESWSENIHPDDKNEYFSTVDFSISKKKKYEYSFRIKSGKNEYRWLLETGTPRYSKNKKFIGYVSAAIDTTDRKNLELETTREKAISESEFKIQESLDESQVVALTMTTDGSITFCNKMMLTILGLKKEDIVGANLFEIFIPDASSKINQKTYSQNAVRGSYSEALIGKFFNKQKSEVIVRFNVILLKDSHNEVSGVNLIGENITEGERLKKQLEKSNDQLTELFDNSYDLIQTFDYEGTFQFVNQAWIEKLGYLGKMGNIKFKDLVEKKQWNKTVSNLDKIIKGENIDRFETVFISDQGKKIFVSGRVNCSFDIDGKAQFRGIFYDITERIRTEKAQSLYYKIADFNIESPQFNILYAKLFDELNGLLNVKNFSVELSLTSKVNVPYFKSEFKDSVRLENQRLINDVLSKYSAKKPKQLIIYEEAIQILIQDEIKKYDGEFPKVWLGVQITVAGKVVGLISIHSYDDRSDFGAKDLELLYFIASQISLAIERKTNEEKITDQAARLEAIFESSSHQIWSVDQGYNLTSFNNNHAKMLKSKFDILASIGVEYKSERKKQKRSVIDFWDKKYKKAFEGHTLNFQNQTIDLEGKPYWVEVFINPILKEDGSIEEVSVISNDVTEKKTSELALLESESKFREIFESIEDIYFRCDLHGIISMISSSAKESLGINPKDVIGTNINEYFVSEQSIHSILRNLLKRHKFQNLEAAYHGKKGVKVDFICNVRVLFRNDQIIGFEGVARDISDIKKTNIELKKSKEHAENALAIKERFLANMSHEIRTPMNGIVGMIDLIGSTQLNNEQFDYVKTIKRSSQILMEILDDILDLSKIEAGKMKLKNKPNSLTATFQRLYDLFSEEAKANNINLNYSISKDIPKYVMLDETRLLQVLINLVSNAIKFSDQQGVIDVSLIKLNSTKKAHSFKAQVKDQGIGISKEEIKKLFINFNQLDNSSTKVYSGTGLGLAISRELVRSMGGDIGVVSTPGLGSTFWFTFECAVVDEKINVETLNEDFLKISIAFQNLRILVVDDNKVNRTVASQILEKSGCMVDKAASGLEALSIVKEKTFDLIFMDIQMPNMDGVETTENIKKLGLDNLPPIVAMTAYSMEGDKEKFLSRGLDDYVAKPIRATTIIEKVKEYVTFDPTEVIQPEDDYISENQIVNKQTLDQLAKFGGTELLKSILIDFENEASILIKNCMQLFVDNEIEEIRKELHTLKGSAGTLGIDRLSNLVIKLEKQLKSSDTKNLKPQLEAIDNSFTEFKENYKEILQIR